MLALILIPLMLLSACQKDLTAQQRKLQEKLPSDAELTAAGTLIAQGQVVHIADGDSLTVLASNKESFKIRLQGIDAPERGQAFGKYCKEQLGQLTNGKTVRLISNTLQKLYNMDIFELCRCSAAQVFRVPRGIALAHM